MDYRRKLAIYHKGRESALNVLCQPVKGKPDLKSSVIEQPGVPKLLPNQLGILPVPCPTCQSWLWPNSSATGKYITELEIMLHLGSVDLQILSKILQDVYNHSVLMSERSLLHCSFHKQNNILPQTKIRQQFNTEIFRQHVTRINFKDCTYSPPWVKAFLTHQENQANKVYVSS